MKLPNTEAACEPPLIIKQLSFFKCCHLKNHNNKIIWISFEDKMVYYLMHNLNNTYVLHFITAFLQLGLGNSIQIVLIWIPRPLKIWHFSSSEKILITNTYVLNSCVVWDKYCKTRVYIYKFVKCVGLCCKSVLKKEDTSLITLYWQCQGKLCVGAESKPNQIYVLLTQQLYSICLASNRTYFNIPIIWQRNSTNSHLN